MTNNGLRQACTSVHLAIKETEKDVSVYKRHNFKIIEENIGENLHELVFD